MRFQGEGDDTFEAEMFQSLAVVGLARDFGDVSFGVRAGAVLDGHADVRGGRLDIAPGFIGALAVDWRIFAAPEDPLSLAFTAQLGASFTQVGDDGWSALDLRLALTASRTLFDRLTPYVGVRGFFGPVFWADATGGDTTHVQVAVGLGLEIVKGLSVHVEGAFVAERGLFGGLAYSF